MVSDVVVREAAASAGDSLMTAVEAPPISAWMQGRKVARRPARGIRRDGFVCTNSVATPVVGNDFFRVIEGVRGAPAVIASRLRRKVPECKDIASCGVLARRQFRRRRRAEAPKNPAPVRGEPMRAAGADAIVRSRGCAVCRRSCENFGLRACHGLRLKSYD